MTNKKAHQGWENPSDPSFLPNILVSICLVFFAGLCSGLTIGMMSFDALNLDILILEGSDEEKVMASRILPLVTRHHLLLVTLLLANSLCMEALPLFLDKLVPEVMAIILSVSAVLIFGEVLPQAVFTGQSPS